MSWSLETDRIDNWAYLEDVLTPEECQKIIDLGNTKSKETTTINNYINDESTRKGKIAWLNEKDKIDWLYKKLTDAVITLNNQFFNFDLFGFSESLQFSEYKAPGDHFEAHVDKIYNGPIRKLSTVLQLSDPNTYKGCDLEILTYNKPEVPSRKQGSLIVFPSYILHKVTPITEGTRYSLISWVSGKPFK